MQLKVNWMRAASVVPSLVAMLCLGVHEAVAQSRVVALPSGEHGNVYIVAYAEVADIPESPLYQISVCSPRVTPAGTLRSFVVTLRDDDGTVRLGLVVNATVAGDFTLLEFNVAPEDVENVHVDAEYYARSREQPAQLHPSYSDTLDFGFVRNSRKGVQLDVSHSTMSCRDRADALRNATGDAGMNHPVRSEG